MLLLLMVQLPGFIPSLLRNCFNTQYSTKRSNSGGSMFFSKSSGVFQVGGIIQSFLLERRKMMTSLFIVVFLVDVGFSNSCAFYSWRFAKSPPLFREESNTSHETLRDRNLISHSTKLYCNEQEIFLQNRIGCTPAIIMVTHECQKKLKEFFFTLLADARSL